MTDRDEDRVRVHNDMLDLKAELPNHDAEVAAVRAALGEEK